MPVLPGSGYCLAARQDGDRFAGILQKKMLVPRTVGLNAVPVDPLDPVGDGLPALFAHQRTVPEF